MGQQIFFKLFGWFAEKDKSLMFDVAAVIRVGADEK
jgi:hypothetical protein